MRHRGLFSGVLVAAVLISGAPPLTSAAFAQNAQDLVRSLSVQKPKTRSFQAPAPSPRESRVRSLVKSMQSGATRQITVEERTEVADYVKESGLPSVDIEVFFEYDSAAITAQAKPKLKTLGKALSDAKLKGKTFMIAGHTDAAGSEAYNLALSKRRAEAVKTFLVKSFKLDAEKLVVFGYGEEQLKDKGNPEADENRRVQVVNLAVN